MSKDIYRNKKDFAVEEFATEMPEHKAHIQHTLFNHKMDCANRVCSF